MSLLYPCPGCGINRKADEGHHLCRECEGYIPQDKRVDAPPERKYQAVATGAKCCDCPRPIVRGEWIVRLSLARFRHLDC